MLTKQHDRPKIELSYKIDFIIYRDKIYTAV